MSTSKNMSRNAKFAIIVALLVLVITALAVALSPKQASGYTPDSLKSLAACLTEKKATMYGAYWCPHCQAQKKLFGDAAKDLPYVECTEHADECTAKGVTGYPTWIFADGSRVEGEQTFDALAQKTGCALPVATK
jgi:glutaredoxin